MAVEVHVTAIVETGRFAAFAQAVERWNGYRAERGHASARVLHGLSGRMNHVRLVFEYPDLAAFEREEARDSLDPEYARVAADLALVDGSIEYAVYRALGGRGAGRLTTLRRPQLS